MTAAATNDASPALASFKDVALTTARSLRKQVATTGLRLQKDTIFSTLEDFERVNPDVKRMVIIGLTGAGKSTLLNVIGGWRFVQRGGKMEPFKWDLKQGLEPPFKAQVNTDAITKETSFANLSWFEDENRPVLVVDTPGHDDTDGTNIEKEDAREKLKELAADLHNKIKALGHIHAILVLHNDVLSNKLNPATRTLLTMIDQKFQKSEVSCWKNVIVGYSKCNAHDVSWCAGLEAKKQALQAWIKNEMKCSVDVPVLALGGATIEPAPADATDEFEALWRFLEEAPPLDTSKLQPFEGADRKFQALINERDDALLREKAASAAVPIILKLSALVFLLSWRAQLPGILSLALMNVPGLWIFDEAVLIGFFVWRQGPKEVMYASKHIFKNYVAPFSQPYTDKIAEKLGFRVHAD